MTCSLELSLLSPAGIWFKTLLPVGGTNTALLTAMDSVIPIISNRDYTNGSRKEMERGLEARPFAVGIRYSSRPRAPAGIQSPVGIGGSGYDDLQACRT